MAKALFLSGSSRKDSVNKKMARIACNIALAQGRDATWVDLGNYPMPIYNGDLEDAEGLPENAIKLKELFWDHDGLFISSPEYNSSISPLLKNSLDWVSRKHKGDEENLSAFKGKSAAIVAASPGGLGGLRGLVTLRMMLSNIYVTVLPQQLTVPNAYEAFDDESNLKDEKHYKTLEDIVSGLYKLIS